MKKISLVFALSCICCFGGININSASRYELMKFGGLDAGRADALIDYRRYNEITSAADLFSVMGFENYNLDKLSSKFDFVPLPKEQPKEPPKPQKETIIIKERKSTVYRYPNQYKRVKKIGNIEIVESGGIDHRGYKKGYRDGYHDAKHKDKFLGDDFGHFGSNGGYDGRQRSKDESYRYFDSTGLQISGEFHYRSK